MKLMLNQRVVEPRLPAGAAAVDYIRREAGLTGTKVACREGDCGACTVLLGELGRGEVAYRAVNSCLLPLGKAAGRHLVTIEGLSSAELTPVQAAMVQEGATQCGFCAPGIVVSLTAALLDPGWDRRSLEEAVFGNLCRCTGYASLSRAIHRLAKALSRPKPSRETHLAYLIDRGVIPSYFEEIPGRLARLKTGVPPEAPDGIVVGGGTDLMVQCPEVVERGSVAFVGRGASSGVRVTGDEIVIDAAVTFDELSRSAGFGSVVQKMATYMRRVASPQIRHMATLGGNLANASPIGDLSVLLLALGAQVHIEGRAGCRSVPLDDFFLGYKQPDLNPGELIRRVAVSSEPPSAFNFERISRRQHMDIAGVSTAFAAWIRDERIGRIRISAGGVAPIPLLLKETSDALEGRRVSWKTALEAGARARTEASPLSDVRGAAGYRARLLERLVIAHFHVAFGVRGTLP